MAPQGCFAKFLLGALGHCQLIFLGNPFVILVRMLYPILELAVVALWQPPCNRIDPAGSVHVV